MFVVEVVIVRYANNVADVILVFVRNDRKGCLLVFLVKWEMFLSKNCNLFIDIYFEIVRVCGDWKNEV